ncbi:hypothetical protein KKG56_04110 [bacterium]|nr:hypothetical protein [bacterium]
MMKEMKRCLVYAGLAAMVLLALGMPSYAVVPSLINYQGKLTNAGSPVEGTHTVMFKIFDVETAGNSVWNESRDVCCNGGLFSILLGEVTPLNPADFINKNNLYLELVVEGTTLSPRQRIVSTVFSFMAGQAGTATYALQAGTASIAAKAQDADTLTGKAPQQLEVGTASYAYHAGTATYAETAGNSPGTATYASQAGLATYASQAGLSGTATYANQAGLAGTATYAGQAGTATYANQAGLAGTATYASIANYAGTSSYAINAGTATYALKGTHYIGESYGGGKVFWVDSQADSMV